VIDGKDQGYGFICQSVSEETGERSSRRGSYRQDRETASLPTRVFHAVSSPSFSATGTSHKKVVASTGSPPAPWGTSPVGSPRRSDGAPLRYGGLGADPAAAPFLYLPAGLLPGPAFLEGRLGKSKSSMVASAVSRSCRSAQSMKRAFSRFFAPRLTNKLAPLILPPASVVYQQ